MDFNCKVIYSLYICLQGHRVYFQGYGSLGKLGHEPLEFWNKNFLSPKSSKFPFQYLGSWPISASSSATPCLLCTYRAVLAAQTFQVVLLENPCAKETIKKRREDKLPEAARPRRCGRGGEGEA